MESRNYVLEMIKCKPKSIEEFNYDNLSCPPIASMFTPQDIYQLNQIAKSIKYSANPRQKYKDIDQIMRSRGFVKFVSGTNRIAYRPVEDNSFLVKVAYDDIGLGDNPREFSNQFLFKPFVTKVFETTPCGTLATFERVNPITSREEFLSVAEDIFYVINEWFIGEFVLEDFGSRFFMNWGIRKGFGPVLLDFPYVYRLDGKKIFCKAPNPTSPSGCCDGTIDYDAGYNHLYCTKCGVQYRANELSLAIKNNEIVVKSEGDIKMKVILKGGSKSVKREVVTGEYSGSVKSFPSGLKVNPRRVERNYCEREFVAGPEDKKKVEVINETNDNNNFDCPTDVVIRDDRNKEEKVVEKEIIQPVSFDPSLIKKDPKEIIKDLEDIDEETALDMLKKVIEYFDILDKDEKESFKDKANCIIDSRFTDDDCEVYEESEDALSYTDHLSEMLSGVGKNFENASEDEVDEIIDAFVNNLDFEIFVALFKTFITAYMDSNAFKFDASNIETVVDHGATYVNFNLKISVQDGEPVHELISKDLSLPVEITVGEFSECETPDPVIIKDGFNFVAAKVVNTADIIAESSESSKVLVIIDNDGDYITSKNDKSKIIAIDVIDDKAVSALSIVSSNWLNGIQKKVDEFESQNEQMKMATHSTGAMPPANNEDEEVYEESSEEE